MNCRYILLLLIASISSLNVQAKTSDRWFDVELIVFKRNVDVQNASEQLDQHNVYLKQRQRLEVLKAKPATNCLAGKPCLHKQNPVKITNNEMASRGHRLQRLDSSHLQLTNQLKKLERHEGFKPLMHVAWRMPIQNKRKALPIHLFAGKNYALTMNNAEISKHVKGNNGEGPEASQTNKLDVLAALQKEDTIQDLYEIDGDLLIYVERYLFVDSQLIVRTETKKEIPSTPTVFSNTLALNSDAAENEFSAQVVNQEIIKQRTVETKTMVTETLFDQSRRLRSEEIHYLDHPLFGIIIQIRKIPK